MAQMTLDQLIAMLTLQKANLSTYKTEVGATDEEIDAVGKELDNLTYIRAFAETTDANKQAVNAVKAAMFIGEEVTVNALPPMSTGSIPDPSILGGCLQRALGRNKRWKNGPGYTTAIGEALGIETPHTPDDPSTAKPSVSLDAAQSGHDFTAIVKNRAQSDQWILMARAVGDTSWTDLGTFTGRSVDATWAGEAGQPVQIEVRVQLRKSNADYGQLSDIVTVTLNP